jgi:hypothetical protein
VPLQRLSFSASCEAALLQTAEEPKPCSFKTAEGTEAALLQIAEGAEAVLLQTAEEPKPCSFKTAEGAEARIFDWRGYGKTQVMS